MKEPSQPELRQYPSIWQQEPSKTTEVLNLCPNRDAKLAPAEQPTCQKRHRFGQIAPRCFRRNIKLFLLFPPTVQCFSFNQIYIQTQKIS